MIIRTMSIEDFEKIYDLWIHTEGMGLNTADDSKEGIAKYLLRNPNTCFVAEDIHKVALVAFEKNVSGNAFWEKVGFTVRADLVYRNKNIHQLKRIDLI